MSDPKPDAKPELPKGPPFRTAAEKTAYLDAVAALQTEAEAGVVYQEYPKWVDGVLCQDKEHEDAVKHPPKADKPKGEKPESEEPPKAKHTTSTKFA